MLDDFVHKVTEGIELGETKAYARNLRACSLKGAVSLDVYIKDGPEEEHLLCMAVFPGRPPYYRPWMELFCIKDRLNLTSLSDDYHDHYEYYDSAIEWSLLKAFSEELGPGEKIFVEYYYDRETCRCLAMGFPPAVTRQGYRLFNLGFTWFKDWYFSEGGHEGGQKLQGEKPLNEAARAKHLRRIRGEVEAFLENTSNCDSEGDGLRYILRARDRTKELSARIEDQLSEVSCPMKVSPEYQERSL